MNVEETPMTPGRRAADMSLETQVSLLSGQDFWRTQSLPDVGVEAVVLSDGPHGIRHQADAGDHLALTGSSPATCFPPAATLASSWDAALVREVAEALAEEARALGVGVVLGPGMNLKRHPLCGRNFEYYSEDPMLSGRLAAAAVEGIQGQGVGACVKHFAVNNQESHRFVVDAIVDERTLRELYLSSFEHVITSTRPWTVMAAYNSVGGVPATENTHLLNDVLRGEWGFDGVVISDWGASGDRAAGIRAGMDLEMPGGHDLSDSAVLDAVADGTLAKEAVTRSAQRVLDLAARVPVAASTAAFSVDDHDALARRAAAESTVLLRNDGILPLEESESIALIGAFSVTPRYQGAGSSTVTPTRVTTALEAFSERGHQVRYAPGYDIEQNTIDLTLIADAVEAARSSDVAVVMVGLPPIMESEGFDRTTLALPAQHDELVAAVCAANPRTVVVLSNGSPVVLPWRSSVAAILETYLGGQASGSAVVDVLFGDVEPAGRLAETFPESLDQVAAAPYFPGDPHQVEYREGLFIGYRHITTAGLVPAYPFGHGLGYVRTDWSRASIERATVHAGEDVEVTIDVSNPSERATSDVVQVYLHDRTGVVMRPRRELAAFAKVKLDPLESRTVKLSIPARAFAFYDVSRSGWSTPTGLFEIEIARSSADVVETLAIEIKGGVGDVRSADAPDTALIAVDDADFEARLGHPLPMPRPLRPFTRDSTLGELSATAVGRKLKSVLRASLLGGDDAPKTSTTTLMIERALEELPLRAAASFSRGRLSWSAVDLVLDLANRRPVSAAVRVGSIVGREVVARLSGFRQSVNTHTSSD